MPSEIDRFLQDCVNKTILIKLKDSRVIRGKLNSFDEQMNLSLIDAEDTTNTNEIFSLNKIILRGSMILTVSTLDELNN